MAAIVNSRFRLNAGSPIVIKIHSPSQCHFYRRMSPLTGAALDGHYDIVKYLIEQAKADPNLRNDDDFNHLGTALAAASLMGNIEIVELLINKGADVNLLIPNGTDGSALAVASVKGSIEVVELLINKGADVDLLIPNGTDGSALAAASASLIRNTETVELLINRGADVNLLTLNGRYGSALTAASAWGSIEAVKLLINKGADVNMLPPDGKYGSALAAASHLGNVDCVRTLLASGADVNMKLRNGKWIYALQAAVAEIHPGILNPTFWRHNKAELECGKLEVVNLLRSHGDLE